jgi:hypothetical protein
MTRFRTFVFLFLISFAGILWSAYISLITGNFQMGAMIAGIIIFTNVFVILNHFRG